MPSRISAQRAPRTKAEHGTWHEGVSRGGSPIHFPTPLCDIAYTYTRPRAARVRVHSLNSEATQRPVQRTRKHEQASLARYKIAPTNPRHRNSLKGRLRTCRLKQATVERLSKITFHVIHPLYTRNTPEQEQEGTPHRELPERTGSGTRRLKQATVARLTPH